MLSVAEIESGLVPPVAPDLTAAGVGGGDAGKEDAVAEAKRTWYCLWDTVIECWLNHTAQSTPSTRVYTHVYKY